MLLPRARFLSSLHKAAVTMTEGLVESAKRQCAYAAVDQNLDIKRDTVVGIGSGSTVIYVAERVGQLPGKEKLICIPTGFQSKQLILDNGLRVGSIEQYPEIDVSFDGADELDSSLNCIKGGGACLLQEKLVCDCSKRYVLVADDRKNSPVLGRSWKKGVPIEVIPSAYTKVIKELRALGGKPSVRPGAPAKAGPVITDNGNFIIDCDFGEVTSDKLKRLNDSIVSIVGVVETGYFVGMVQKAYIGNQDGSVTELNV